MSCLLSVYVMLTDYSTCNRYLSTSRIVLQISSEYHYGIYLKLPINTVHIPQRLRGHLLIYLHSLLNNTSITYLKYWCRWGFACVNYNDGIPSTMSYTTNHVSSLNPYRSRGLILLWITLFVEQPVLLSISVTTAFGVISAAWSYIVGRSFPMNDLSF